MINVFILSSPFPCKLDPLVCVPDPSLNSPRNVKDFLTFRTSTTLKDLPLVFQFADFRVRLLPVFDPLPLTDLDPVEACVCHL